MLLSLSSPANANVVPFDGTDQTLEMMGKYALGPEGEQSFYVRQWAESIVREVPPKDYLSEILALYGWAKSPALRYTNDALHVEQVKSPLRILREIEQTGTSLVDCDDIATLLCALGMVLGRRAQFAVVGFSAPEPSLGRGSRVRSPGQFTHVFARLLEPRSKEWIFVDPVAGTRDAEMAKRTTSSMFVDVET